ncbi:MAG: translation initiation factor IF-2 [Acidobacteriota bacterium]|nr:translation initiation factor IF-2 [Acidobacteriota bacterium]
MKKIRINELARVLEIKANLILDKLPDFGVTEKKTHSSSVDEDVAEKLRVYFENGGHREEAGGEDRGQESEASSRPSSNGHGASAPEPVEAQPEAREEKPEPARAEAGPEHIVATAPAETVKVAPPVPVVPEVPAQPAEPEKPAPRMALRPPLATGPIHAPISATPPPSGQRPSAPSAGPGRPIPPAVRPMPTAPRPGQVLSGPRQPFPGGMPQPRPAAPPRPAGPSTPRVAAASRPASEASPQIQTPAPGGPPPGQRPLVGQPALRPVVPPRPDLARKLQQPMRPLGTNPAFAAPAASPKPGVPLRQQSPAPGRPIYQGPIRPGQPMVQRGMPGPGMRTGQPLGHMGQTMQRPGSGPRPMHPTTRGGMAAPGAAPTLPDQQRRPPSRFGTRPPSRPRTREDQEKSIRPVRRDMPAGPPPINRDITISEGITVKELSEKLDVKANFVIKKLVDRNIFATINQTLDAKLATELSREFGASTSTISFEEESRQDVEVAEVEKDQVRRAPVVTIMGHVDHGKTSLLDAIRHANVAGREAGGITQHIGAYHIDHGDRQIVFIDTPGHEAFTRMRSRGAKVTDIVILVVAADDGVMPQTLEAIDHAKAAKVPIIVAINKIDKPDAQPDRIKQQLSDRGLLAEDWGGDTVMVPVSAKSKTNLDLLLEMILLVADLQDLKANPARPAMGVVLEAKLDRGRGPVPTVLVRNGTLRVGDFFIVGQVFGKVRAMLSDRGEQVREAGPSMPVEVLGLDAMPDAGDSFQVVTDTAKAKQIVMYREIKARDVAMAKTGRLTLEQLHQQMAAGEVKELPLIIKADVGGSAEVLSETLQKLSTDKVKIRVLHSGVGAITESDVLLASASNAIVIGFNVRPERNAAAAAEQEKVDIRLHSIIYNVTDEIKKAMAGLLSPVFKEVYRGKAVVLDTFRVSNVGMVAGCFVQDGTITTKCLVRVLRDNVVVHTGKIGSLRRFKDDVSEVRSGTECGVTIDNFGDVKKDDVLEAFVSERVVGEVA